MVLKILAKKNLFFRIGIKKNPPKLFKKNCEEKTKLSIHKKISQTWLEK